MSLTTNDLNKILNIIESAISIKSGKIVKPIQDELQALRSDIKEIYDMISDLSGKILPNEQFQKLNNEQKL